MSEIINMLPHQQQEQEEQQQQRGEVVGTKEGLLEEVKCPICNSIMRNLICPKHGTICKACGMLYKDLTCPNCFPSTPSEFTLAKIDRSLLANRRTSIPLGERGLVAKQLGAITAKESVSKLEANILKGITSNEDPHRKKIRMRAEGAIKWLNLPRNAETFLLEAVEKNALAITKGIKNDNSKQRELKKRRISYEKIIEYSLLSEAKKIGKTILEVQEALAKAGFDIKLQPFSLRISVPKNVDISSVGMYVNGWKREEDTFKPKFAGEGPLGVEYSVNFHALLSDTIDSRGRLGEREWMEVRFGNAIIVSDDNSALVDKSHVSQSRWYLVLSSPRKEKVNYIQKGPSTVLLRLNRSKCFSLFKAMNQMLDSFVTKQQHEEQNWKEEIEGSIRQHPPLSSKKFPASAAIMQRAHCLSQVERRSVELFRESLKNSKGRSHHTLAQIALMQADKEVFAAQPLSVRLYVKGYVSTLPLKRKDRSYTGIKGFLIPSEILQNKGRRRLAMKKKIL
jgi:hypothetical protein